MQRAAAVERLRAYYGQLCTDRLRLHQPPKESFNHWLFQMFAVSQERRVEPIVPAPAQLPSSMNQGVSPIQRQLLDVRRPPGGRAARRPGC